jgi:hypothetical protein
MCLLAQEHSPPKAFFATVRVTLVDDNGAVIPGARAALINLHTLDILKAVADKDGHLAFDELQLGNYELIVAPPPRYTCLDSAVRRLRAKAAKRLTLTVKLSFQKCKFIH